MSVPIRNRQSHRDPIARAHRRASIMRATGAVVGVVIIVGGLGWVFLFSSVFAVSDIRVSGAKIIGDERIRAFISDVLDRRALQLFQPARNIVLLDAGAVAAHVLESDESIERVSVEKRYPHSLEVAVTERVAFGLWCRGDECRYFDRTGARWGSAVPSRGQLLVRVQDERESSDVPERLIRGLLVAVDGFPELGLHVVSVSLPDSAPGDSRFTTDKRYAVLLDLYGDVEDQLATVGVLLSDKAKDAGWAPQYIDVRTPGRAYYR